MQNAGAEKMRQDRIEGKLIQVKLSCLDDGRDEVSVLRERLCEMDELQEELQSEVSSSRTRCLELEYELEKRQDVVVSRDKEILQLQTQMAKLQESYVGLELSMKGKRVERGRDDANHKNDANGSDNLRRLLSKAERALEQERRTVSKLRKEVGTLTSEKLSVPTTPPPSQDEDSALRKENDTLKSRLDTVKSKCLAASTTIEKLINENIDYMDKINQQSYEMNRLKESAKRVERPGDQVKITIQSDDAIQSSSRESDEQNTAGRCKNATSSTTEAAKPVPKKVSRSWLGFITGADLVEQVGAA